MGTDKRELILARLFVVLQTVPGFVTIARNRGEIENAQRPSLVMLDGDEVAHEAAQGRGRIAASPNLVSLNPEIFISLKGAKPQNENVGQLLSAFRVAVLKAIQQDSELGSLCDVETGGEIQYKGCDTDLGRNRNMSGEMGLNIAFVYAFKPSEL
jgi:hypothetical protein